MSSSQGNKIKVMILKTPWVHTAQFSLTDIHRPHKTLSLIFLKHRSNTVMNLKQCII